MTCTNGRVARIGLVAVSLALAACDSPTTFERPDSNVPEDAPFTDDAPFVRVDAPTIDRDGGGVDAGASMGLQCQSCVTDTDCAMGSYCTELREGAFVCLDGCDRDLPDCPDRFECIDSLAVPLPEPVCAPVGERCCVDADADDHGVGVGCRGLDCNESDPLANAGASERCNGQDDDCDGMVDEGDPGAGVVCSTGMTGACSSGVTACVDGELLCQPPGGAAPETCNGVDDDCDADVDEDDMGRALTRSCYDGPAGTDGVGGCTAGVQTCAGGEYRGCVGQVLPGVEDCDDVDDDCDGVVDDGNPGGGFACASSAPGACGPGMTQCRAGIVSCVGTIAPGDLPETCDAEDNDCDGMLNEGFPGLGGACTVGMGACRRGGVTGCDPADPSAPPICNGTPGTPAPAETCDYVDDDCDGSVDEGFRNAAGTYTAVTDCGACGFDCALGWPGGPAVFHVVPRCAVSGSSATCGFTCEAGWVDADGVRDNGCELFPEPDTIYVSTPTNGGADVAGCGAWDMPCGSIGGGIMRAVAASRVRVRVSAGLYVENVTLVRGISVLGGHSHVNWVRNTSVNTTVIRGANAASAAGGANDRIVVSAVSITSTTELSGFSIEGIAAAAGGNSIGVYIRDSTNALLVQDNSISAGTGGNGSNGTSGASGVVGGSGGPGAGPEARACFGAAIAGGTAGSGTCGGASVSGGVGGAGTNPVTSAGAPTRSGTGGNGAAAGGGAGGLGGFHMEGAPSGGGGRTCTVYANPTDGAVGAAGAPGADGSGGAGGTSSTGSVSGGQWRGVGGSAGGAATSGGGGGGGGSPAGVDANGSAYCLYPPSGGGGGAGGCQGTAGGAGGAGGASFGVFIVHSAAPTAATMPRLVSNRIRRASGGLGGDGGTGGGGGEGGAGGAGGPGASADSYGFCLVAGAPGGVGGRGGHAGGGGAGAGGVSYDIWVSRPGGATPDFSTNTFEIPAGTPTGGAGGTGGNSSNTAIGIGASGATGASGNTRIGT